MSQAELYMWIAHDEMVRDERERQQNKAKMMNALKK